MIFLLLCFHKTFKTTVKYKKHIQKIHYLKHDCHESRLIRFKLFN